ncbi:hypothetical protein ACFQPF_08140 [Fictibacillus iocasae]|uniref:Uncharacterized protein n=1 Tax=Fictibacillus iocasae TaxID=2715437 RepID=A0ABW2NME4_9BACL
MDWFMLVISVVLFGLGAAAVVYSWRYSRDLHESLIFGGGTSSSTADSIPGAIVEFFLGLFFDFLFEFIPYWMVKVLLFLGGVGVVVLAYLAFLEV